MKTLIFDETCAGWTRYVDLNIAYLGLQKDYLNERLIAKGYLYLNEIYEAFGFAWDPKDENICYEAEYGPIDITFMHYKGSDYAVMIH